MKVFLVFCAVIMLFNSACFAAPKRKSIVFKEVEIKGVIQKPEAIYFLSRARFNYKSLDLNMSFIDKVQKAVYTDNAF